MNFLGHIIGPEAISADSQRIAAILSYPAPRNQKQLRQFIGTCGFYYKFVINYAGRKVKKKKDMVSDTVYRDTTRRCLRTTFPTVIGCSSVKKM